VAVEALVRWQRDHQLLLPAEFIDVAEDSGLIVDIDRLVLSTACRTAAGIDDQLTVNVNLSSRQLADRDLVSLVTGMLDTSGLPPERLCLELTERALISAGAGVDAALQVLRQQGVRVALDDFGTGYASLTYLRRFAVDVVKIDHSFVRGMLTSRDDHAIVAATIDLAHELGLSTVAEGVETPEQERVLTDMGCDRLQGFWYSRAVHSADLPRHPVA
ncbi:MAG: EAL domain-containing protein, partial [Actinomycetota bacterium]